jgi:DNA-binding NarL/FixJ family response regulator
MRVLIADDQAPVRSAMKLALNQRPGKTVVDEAEDLVQVLNLTGGRRPDLVLLDWELPRRGGQAALRGLHAAWPGLAVIALSGRPEARQAALSAGARAFVSKGDPPDRLLEAVARLTSPPSPSGRQ